MSRPPGQKAKEKAEERINEDFTPESIKEQIERFLALGGKIQQIPIGESAYNKEGSVAVRHILHTQICGFQPNAEEKNAKRAKMAARKNPRLYTRVGKGGYKRAD